MDDRLWFVAQDEDGYYSTPRTAYPNRLLAEASAYIANQRDPDPQYFVDSIPLLGALPRIERARRLTVFLAPDGARLVSEDRIDNIVHLDPDEADEANVIAISHNRAWWNAGETTAAIRITAYGTDHQLVRDSVAARESYFRRNWPSDVWTATYDVIADTSSQRRRTRDFDTWDSAIAWLAEHWNAKKISPVEVAHWPGGTRSTGEVLHQKLVKQAGL